MDAHTDSTPTDTHTSESYFVTHVRQPFTLSVRALLEEALAGVSAGDKASCVLPYRILRVLLDKAEVADSISSLLTDITGCLKDQLELLGGTGSSQTGLMRQSTSGDEAGGMRGGGGGGGGGAWKKAGKKGQLKSELVYSALQLLVAMEGERLWGWMRELLARSLQGAAPEEEERKEEAGRARRYLSEALTLVQFTVDALPLVRAIPNYGHPCYKHKVLYRWKFCWTKILVVMLFFGMYVMCKALIRAILGLSCAKL